MSKNVENENFVSFPRIDWLLLTLTISMGAPEGYFWSINHGCIREVILFPGYMAAIFLFNFSFRKIMRLFIGVNIVAFIVQFFLVEVWIYSAIGIPFLFLDKTMPHFLYVLCPALLIFFASQVLQKRKSRPEPLGLWTRCLLFIVSYGLYVFLLKEKIPIWTGWNCHNLH